jgi:hypothetical protein
MAAWIDAGRRDSPAHPWLAEVVFAFDAILRHRLQVVEYSTDPACIFRLNISGAEQTFVLADRTRVRIGDRIVNLHLWNEQIPPVPSAGPTLSWARTFCGRLDLSMRELARYFSRHPDLNDVAAIGANVAQGTREQRAQLTNIMRRFGFAPLPDGECTCAEAALRRFAENVLISAMVWARNPVVLRADSLWRDRTPLFVSRTALLERYGIRPRVTSSPADGLWRTC